VNDALAHGFVDFARSNLHGSLSLVLVATGNRFTSLTNSGLQFAFHSAVALFSLLVGLVALNLRLDVCHEFVSPSR